MKAEFSHGGLEGIRNRLENVHRKVPAGDGYRTSQQDLIINTKNEPVAGRNIFHRAWTL